MKQPNYYFQACKRIMKLERDLTNLLDECPPEESNIVSDLLSFSHELSKRIRTLRKTPGSHAYNEVTKR